MERDTAIIGYLCDMFSRKTIGPNILTSKNKMRVIFYPIPKIPNINALAKNLDVDVSAYKGIEKRKTIEAMHSNFVSSLLPIYNETQKSSKWLGCDIWDFFSSGRIKTQCMEEGARNIVIILSDGFLFHEKNKIREGNAYSYVLPQTLKNQKSSLIVRRNDLQDIEVLMLEINAKNTTERDKLKEVLRTWFCEMGVKHICIEETDLTIQTQRVIDEFFRE